MKILYHHRTQGGWVEAVHINGIVDGLRAMGHEVCVVGPPLASAPGGGGSTAASRTARLVARKLPQSAFELLELAYNMAAYPRLLRAANEMRPDVIYERASAYGMAGARVSRRLGLPLVVEFNDVAGQAGVRHQRFASLARRLEAQMLPHVDAAVTVTSYLRDQLIERGVDPQRITVIANGVDPERFHPAVDGRPVREKFGIGPEDCLVGFSGAMSAWYRLDEVAEEFARTFAAAPHMRLLLMGDGPEREALRCKIEALNRSDQIILGPRVPHHEVPAHVAAFDIALIPHCDRHNSPVKLFEYMAMARPVVAVRTPGITDVVTHGREALLADAGDLKAVMGHVGRLAEKPGLAAALGRAGRELVLARHTWQRNAEWTYAILESVVRPGVPAEWDAGVMSNV